MTCITATSFLPDEHISFSFLLNLIPTYECRSRIVGRLCNKTFFRLFQSLLSFSWRFLWRFSWHSTCFVHYYLAIVCMCFYVCVGLHICVCDTPSVSDGSSCRPKTPCKDIHLVLFAKWPSSCAALYSNQKHLWHNSRAACRGEGNTYKCAMSDRWRRHRLWIHSCFPH